MVNVPNGDIVVNEFELPQHYCVHFWTNTPWERYETLITPAII